MHLLLLLLVSALAVPPVLLQSAYQKFAWQHAHFDKKFVDCNEDMNLNLELLNMPCLKQNTFILGDESYGTDLEALDKVCSTGGTKVEGNHYKSNKEFRVVTCKLISGDRPPKCKYEKVTTENIQTRPITVGCSVTPTSFISES